MGEDDLNTNEVDNHIGEGPVTVHVISRRDKLKQSLDQLKLVLTDIVDDFPESKVYAVSIIECLPELKGKTIMDATRIPCKKPYECLLNYLAALELERTIVLQETKNQLEQYQNVEGKGSLIVELETMSYGLMKIRDMLLIGKGIEEWLLNIQRDIKDCNVPSKVFSDKITNIEGVSTNVIAKHISELDKETLLRDVGILRYIANELTLIVAASKTDTDVLGWISSITTFLELVKKHALLK